MIIDIIAMLMYLLTVISAWIKDKDTSCMLLGTSLAVLWVYVMAIVRGVF